MAIARRRAETMAATDVLSHQNPDGTNVFDAIVAAGIPWFGAGEVIVWNNYPTEARLHQPGRRRLVRARPRIGRSCMSADYNYAGFGAAVSPVSGNRYYAGVFLKRTDRTAAWARAATTTKRVVDATHAQVTVRWTGGDPRLQVLTAGLRDYEIQRRVVGGTWRALGYRTTTSVTETLPSRAYLRIPDPRARQGRQSRPLGAHHRPGLAPPNRVSGAVAPWPALRYPSTTAASAGSCHAVDTSRPEHGGVRTSPGGYP